MLKNRDDNDDVSAYVT